MIDYLECYRHEALSLRHFRRLQMTFEELEIEYKLAGQIAFLEIKRRFNEELRKFQDVEKDNILLKELPVNAKDSHLEP